MCIITKSDSTVIDLGFTFEKEVQHTNQFRGSHIGENCFLLC